MTGLFSKPPIDLAKNYHIIFWIRQTVQISNLRKSLTSVEWTKTYILLWRKSHIWTDRVQAIDKIRKPYLKFRYLWSTLGPANIPLATKVCCKLASIRTYWFTYCRSLPFYHIAHSIDLIDPTLYSLTRSTSVHIIRVPKWSGINVQTHNEMVVSLNPARFIVTILSAEKTTGNHLMKIHCNRKTGKNFSCFSLARNKVCNAAI